MPDLAADRRLPFRQQRVPSLVRIHLEEDENSHASNRNIKPNRKRNARNSTVRLEAACQREE
jgi:hypothetical protein